MTHLISTGEKAAERDPDGVTMVRSRRGSVRTTMLRWASAGWRPLLAVLVLIGIWWLITAIELAPPYLVPSPQATWQTIVDNPGYLWDNTLITAYETLAAFVLSVIIGLLAAVAMVYSKTVEKTAYPLLVLAQVVPKIALAPLFVVWLGFGLTPKILIALLIAFFPVVVSGYVGLRSIDPEMLDLASTMGAGPVQKFLRFRFPASLPHLFSGLKVAVTLAVTGAVVGDFVGSNEGLGNVILEANGNVNTALLFAALIVLSVLGVVLFLLVELIERLVMPWHSTVRQAAVTTS
jgi:NitT/TauT family transport system permease protein